MAASLRPAEATQWVPGQHGLLTEKQIKPYTYIHEGYNYNPFSRGAPNSPNDDRLGLLLLSVPSALILYASAQSHSQAGGKKRYPKCPKPATLKETVLFTKKTVSCQRSIKFYLAARVHHTWGLGLFYRLLIYKGPTKFRRQGLGRATPCPFEEKFNRSITIL